LLDETAQRGEISNREQNSGTVAAGNEAGSPTSPALRSTDQLGLETGALAGSTNPMQEYETELMMANQKS